MPTFTDASLIAAGSGTLLWAVLATEASSRRRTWSGLAGFAAIEIATFACYTDIVILGCAVVTVIAAWRLRAAKLPRGTLGWWLTSVAVFLAGVAIFDDLVYGGPLTTGTGPVTSGSASAPSCRICGTFPPTLCRPCRRWCSGWPRWRGSSCGGDRRDLPARRPAGDQDSRPGMAGRAGDSRHCHGAVRLGRVVLSHHGRVQARVGLRQAVLASGVLAGN